MKRLLKKSLPKCIDHIENQYAKVESDNLISKHIDDFMHSMEGR
jgi:hypothetical protein